MNKTGKESLNHRKLVEMNTKCSRQNIRKQPTLLILSHWFLKTQNENDKKLAKTLEKQFEYSSTSNFLDCS